MKLNKKWTALLVCAALLLTITVSGTVAYLVDSTGSLVNTFTPTEVNTTIYEDFTPGGSTKSNIKVVNSSNSKAIPVYVRVALVGNWCDANGNVVDSWSPSFTPSNDWVKNGGFYYYKYIVGNSESTSDLLNGTSISGVDTNRPGLHLEVTVLHQSIQANPKDAVEEAWGSDVANLLENITKPSTN